jgi:hypothetical protein
MGYGMEDTRTPLHVCMAFGVDIWIWCIEKREYFCIQYNKYDFREALAMIISQTVDICKKCNEQKSI